METKRGFFRWLVALNLFLAASGVLVAGAAPIQLDRGRHSNT